MPALDKMTLLQIWTGSDGQDSGLTFAQRTHDFNALNRGVSRFHGFKSQRGIDYLFQLAMIAFNHVAPVLYLLVLHIRRTFSFVLQQRSARPYVGALSVLISRGICPRFVLFRSFPIKQYAVLLLRREDR